MVGVDSTFATPLNQQPLDYGADVVMHSATKFIGGHSDLLAGVLVTRDDALYEEFHHRRLLHGATIGAMEAFFTIRGARTMGLRLDRAQQNAMELATRLEGHAGHRPRAVSGVAQPRHPRGGEVVHDRVRRDAVVRDDGVRRAGQRGLRPRRADQSRDEPRRGRVDHGTARGPGRSGAASPIGDMPPVLIALEASLRLTSTRGARDLPLEDFFLDYRKTALAANEVIESITVPKLWPHEVFFCDKLSKRRDQDISTVAAGYRLKIKSGRVEDARIAFGGMAATPKRAPAVEAALKKDGFAAAIAAVEADFKPIDDWRGSAAYRLQAAKNLLRRLELRVVSPGQVVEVEAL